MVSQQESVMAGDWDFVMVLKTASLMAAGMDVSMVGKMDEKTVLKEGWLVGGREGFTLG